MRVDAVVGERRDRVLDERRRVLLPEHDVAAAGRRASRAAREPGALGLGALGQRRGAADGVVAAHAGRPAARRSAACPRRMWV